MRTGTLAATAVMIFGCALPVVPESESALLTEASDPTPLLLEKVVDVGRDYPFFRDLGTVGPPFRFDLTNAGQSSVFTWFQDGHALGHFSVFDGESWLPFFRGGACGTGIRINELKPGEKIEAGEAWLFSPEPLPIGPARFEVPYYVESPVLEDNNLDPPDGVVTVEFNSSVFERDE